MGFLDDGIRFGVRLWALRRPPGAKAESTGAKAGSAGEAPGAGPERELERASERLSGSLGPVARRISVLGDRARDGLLDALVGGAPARDRPLLETWRRLDLVGRGSVVEEPVGEVDEEVDEEIAEAAADVPDSMIGGRGRG